MNYAHFVNPLTNPLTIHFFRKDFVDYFKRCYSEDNGLTLKKLTKYMPLDDICENIGLDLVMSELNPFCELKGNENDNLYTCDKSLNEVFQICKNNNHARAALVKRYHVTRLEDLPYVFPSMNDPLAKYKLCPNGSKLFIGIDESFYPEVGCNKLGYRTFLTNCLEVCRITAPDQEMKNSKLYRNFIFTNVNI